MIIKSFVFDAGPLEVNQVLMADEQTGEGLMVDAGVFHNSVIEFAADQGIKVSKILITHMHADHVAALADYAKAWDASVVAPAPVSAAPGARIVGEGDTVQAGPFEFEIFQTSGHTPESISYYCKDQSLCFVGDAIFAGAVGGTPLDELHAEQIGHLQRTIMTLPPETELFSGHGPLTTVEIEKAANPFLQPGFTRLP